MPNDEIYALKDCFVKALDPLRVYLFGSYAYGTPTEDSDFDFYIVVDDSQTDSYILNLYSTDRNHRRSKVEKMPKNEFSKAIFDKNDAISIHPL